MLVSESRARDALSKVREVYASCPSGIQTVTVDGFIAHVNLGGQKETLSLARAQTIKETLVGMGVAENKITVNGKGFGPYGQPELDRMVRITIKRGDNSCK